MRIIINVDAKMSENIAIARVHQVIKGGKVSRSKGKECFCICSSFTDCVVTAELTKKGTHIFGVF